MNNFSERLRKLFSDNITNNDMYNLFNEYCHKFYEELKDKYSLPEFNEVVNKVELYNKIDLPEDSNEFVAGILINNDELSNFDLAICPENTRKYYNKDKQYYSSIEDYVKVSSAHEICHVVSYYLKKADLKNNHSTFWISIYAPLKSRYCKIGVKYDPIKDIADFSRKRITKTLIPRVPSTVIDEICKKEGRIPKIYSK